MKRALAASIGAIVVVGAIVAGQGGGTFVCSVAGFATGKCTKSAPLNMGFSTNSTFSGAGTVVSPLSASAVNALRLSIWFGDGSDGDCTFDGTSVVLGIVPGACQGFTTTCYTITRDIFCDDMDVASGAAVTGPYRIFVSGTLSGSGRIHRDGNAGAEGTAAGGAGGAALAAGTLGASIAGITGQTRGGGNCATTDPTGSTAMVRGCTTAGAAQTPPTVPLNTAGANGADGGLCMGGAAGAGGSQSNGGNIGGACINGAGTLRAASSGDIHQLLYSTGDPVTGWTSGSAGGRGGGGGAVGGSGGGGGGGAAPVVVRAFNVTGSLTVSSKGGNGGHGGDHDDDGSASGSGGGGGGGASGGWISFVYAKGTAPTFDVSGGTGGTGGLGNHGAGTLGGDGGAGGNGGAGVLTVRKLGLP